MRNLYQHFEFIILNLLITFNLVPICGYLFFSLLCFAFFVFGEMSVVAYISTIIIFAFIPLSFFTLKFAIYPMLYEMYKGQEFAGKFFNKIETNKRFTKLTITIACIIDTIYWMLIHKIDEDILNLVPELKIMCELLLGILPCVLSLLLWFKIKEKKHGKFIMTITSLIYALIILWFTYSHSILYTDFIKH